VFLSEAEWLSQSKQRTALRRIRRVAEIHGNVNIQINTFKVVFINRSQWF
jgi:hypothetical protein